MSTCAAQTCRLVRAARHVSTLYLVALDFLVGVAQLLLVIVSHTEAHSLGWEQYAGTFPSDVGRTTAWSLPADPQTGPVASKASAAPHLFAMDVGTLVRCIVTAGTAPASAAAADQARADPTDAVRQEEEGAIT